MSLRKNIMFVLAIVTMFLMLLFIVFGENGLTDLHKLKMEKDNLSKKNEELKKENLSLYREIERLKNDPSYVEDVARKELGVIGENEVIIKVKPKQRVSDSNKNNKK
ncbi:MAG: septum formation initiator family protein [Deltaproteobacteria bacterium]|nr:septum formation initiator family protein [Deltaproteobacteria bacterium]